MFALSLRRTAGALAVAALLGTPLLAHATPGDFVPAPEPKVRVTDIAMSGTGCSTPQSGAIAVSPDNETLHFVHNEENEYMVEAGPGIAAERAHRTCHLGLTMHLPAGYQVGVWKGEFRGLVQLHGNATASRTVSYGVAPDSPATSVTRTFTAPMDASYVVTHEPPLESVELSACGGPVRLSLDSSLSVDAGTAKERNFLTSDSTDLIVHTKLHFAWKKC